MQGFLLSTAARVWPHALSIRQDPFYRRIIAEDEQLQWEARQDIFAESLAEPGAEHHEAMQGLLLRSGGP